MRDGHASVKSVDAIQHLRGGENLGVDVAQDPDRGPVHLGHERATTVLDQDHVESAIGRVGHGGVNATGRDDPVTTKRRDPEIAQDVLDIGGAED